MDNLQVIEFATERHAGQKYGERDYVSSHLAEVAALVAVIARGDADLETAAWLHDVVEDTSTTLDEVRTLFGDGVATLVWAVTSAGGKNRKERNAATYPKIREAGSRAVVLKLCDRISNVEACWASKDAKLFMYQREYRDFRHALRREEDGPAVLALWKRLDNLLGWWEPSESNKSSESR